MGHVTVTYMDYIDTATGKTLVCSPGNSYNVQPASGHPTSAGTTMPNDGRFNRNDLVELDEEEPTEETSGDEKEKTPIKSRRGVTGQDTSPEVKEN